MKKNDNTSNVENAAAGQNDEVRAERSFKMQRQLGEQLLNQLGFSESTTDLLLWMRLSIQASVNQAIEERHLDTEGMSPVGEVEFTLRVPSEDAVDALVHEAKAQLSELTVHSVQALAEFVGDRRIKLRGEFELSAPVLTGLTTKLIVMVDGHEGSLEMCQRVDDLEGPMGRGLPTNLTKCCAKDVSGEWRAPAAPLKLKMRCEFLSDALLLRLALAPWVLGWKEAELYVPVNRSTGNGPEMSAMDRSIEFEVTESAPKLDHLRWLLSKVTDLHVAAESLNYAERYDGNRLPYDMVERMEPPDDVAVELAERLRKITEATLDLVERLHEALI